jgi:hypothetical protein
VTSVSGPGSIAPSVSYLNVSLPLREGEKNQALFLDHAVGEVAGRGEVGGGIRLLTVN